MLKGFENANILAEAARSMENILISNNINTIRYVCNKNSLDTLEVLNMLNVGDCIDEFHYEGEDRIAFERFKEVVHDATL